MTTPISTVFVVDDDPAVLKAVARLLTSAGYRVESYRSARQFLDSHDPETSGCLVLDVAMPGCDGLTLQQTLSGTAGNRPIVFITGHGDIPTSVRAIKAGAVDFLPKPFDGRQLLAAVRLAIEQDEANRQERARHRFIEQRYAMLTAREREVLRHVVSGQLNKQIAADLGTSEKTIKVHRSRVMQKMAAGSLAELVRMADEAGIEPAPAERPGR
jgi:FixJ family two-component response regulator